MLIKICNVCGKKFDDVDYYYFNGEYCPNCKKEISNFIKELEKRKKK